MQYWESRFHEELTCRTRSHFRLFHLHNVQLRRGRVWYQSATTVIIYRHVGVRRLHSGNRRNRRNLAMHGHCARNWELQLCRYLVGERRKCEHEWTLHGPRCGGCCDGDRNEHSRHNKKRLRIDNGAGSSSDDHFGLGILRSFVRDGRYDLAMHGFGAGYGKFQFGGYVGSNPWNC